MSILYRILQEGGTFKTTAGQKVMWGTPEYAKAYHRGEVITDKGIKSPVTFQGQKLKEVEVQNNYKRNILEEYKDKIIEENKNAGVLGAAVGVPISAVSSIPQLAITRILSGKMQRPSEAMSIQNPYGAFATDIIADPLALTGAGVFAKEKILAKLASSTEKGMLSKVYKINPLSEKLNNINKSYRVAGMGSYDDFKSVGSVRSIATRPSIEELSKLPVIERFAAMPRPTSFPSFQKGFADIRYMPKEGGVVYETSVPTFKRGEINPITKLKIKGRHYAHRPIDMNTGKVITDLPAKDVKVFHGTPHWLKGFQEIKQAPTSYLQKVLISPINQTKQAVSKIVNNNSVLSIGGRPVSGGPLIERPLPKEMTPYISKKVFNDGKEQQVFESSFPPEIQSKMVEERTRYYNAKGDGIPKPDRFLKKGGIFYFSYCKK